VGESVKLGEKAFELRWVVGKFWVGLESFLVLVLAVWVGKFWFWVALQLVLLLAGVVGLPVCVVVTFSISFSAFATHSTKLLALLRASCHPPECEKHGCCERGADSIVEHHATVVDRVASQVK